MTLPLRASAITLVSQILLVLTVSGEEKTDSVAITIYSTSTPGAVSRDQFFQDDDDGFFSRSRANQIPGYAIVRQDRGLTLNDGISDIRITDVAAKIEPTTVTFMSLTDSKTTHVLEQSFEFDLVNRSKLLERFIDQSISVERQVGDRLITETGVLLSNGDSNGMVLRTIDGQIRIHPGYGVTVLPELPGGLITRPTLVWKLSTESPGEHQVRLTYETAGMTWWADYNVIFVEGSDANTGLLDIGAWVSIINKSGTTYPDARLKLMAGDVHRAPGIPPPSAQHQLQQRNFRGDVEDTGFVEKAFFEYHLYTLGRPTTLPDNSTKQIELFSPARSISCEKTLVYYGLDRAYRGVFPSPMTDRDLRIQANNKVDIYLQFKNTEAEGLGIPLPSGRIRVSKRDADDGALEFIGEDVIDHTPKDEPVSIRMGCAFDVVGERRQVNFRLDHARRTMEEDIEVKIRNHKSEPVKVLIRENLFRWVNWDITAKSHDFEKLDARTIHFPVQVASDGETVVTYTVQYTW